MRTKINTVVLLSLLMSCSTPEVEQEPCHTIQHEDIDLTIKSMKDYAAMNAVWDAWIAEGHPPARTCVESKLYAPDVLVEMTVTAVKPD